MACIRYIQTCIFILALTIPFSEGRQMKAFKKQKFTSFVENEAKKATKEKNIPVRHEGEFQIAPLTPNADFFSGRKVSTSTNKNSEFGTMLSYSPTYFRPTAPGNLPEHGRGTVKGEDNQQMPTSSSSHPAHTLSSSPDDFKPTDPGRSPGVGHSSKP